MSTLLLLHVFSLGFSFCLIVLSDKEAFAWFSGKRETLDAERIKTYHFLTWAGLLSLIGSGFFMLYPSRLYLLGEPLFVSKLFFVAVLFVNAILIGRLMKTALTRSFTSLSSHEKLGLVVSGAASFIAWFAAAIIGYIISNT